eukprot:m.209640 g.209640  ORF g.209640 m.209640 type:complete len:71 (+) comp15475_c0_seq3:276-488(+)
MAAVQQVLMLVAATATVSVATACGPMTTISGSQLHCTFPQLNQGEFPDINIPKLTQLHPCPSVLLSADTR